MAEKQRTLVDVAVKTFDANQYNEGDAKEYLTLFFGGLFTVFGKAARNCLAFNINSGDFVDDPILVSIVKTVNPKEMPSKQQAETDRILIGTEWQIPKLRPSISAELEIIQTRTFRVPTTKTRRFNSRNAVQLHADFVHDEETLEMSAPKLAIIFFQTAFGFLPEREQTKLRKYMEKNHIEFPETPIVH